MESKESNINDKLLEYLNGELSADEQTKVKSWIEETPENTQEFSSLKSIWEAVSVVNDVKIDVNKRWANTSKKINNTNRSGSIRVWISRVAAIFIIAFLLGGVSIYFLLNPHTARDKEISKISTITPLGSKSKVILSDNTEVWLNAGSTLVYPENFAVGKERVVELSGEAFFKVAKKTDQPFLVNALGYTIKALGTSFNVKAYKDEKFVEATLVEGLVSINKEGSSEKVMLKPKQVASMDRTISSISISEVTVNEQKKKKNKIKKNLSPENTSKSIKIKSNVNTELYTSWKDNRWIIRNEELSTLATKLERKFGVTILFKDEIVKEIRFTGSLEDESLEQVLKVISYAAPVDFVVQGKKVYLHKKKNDQGLGSNNIIIKN